MLHDPRLKATSLQELPAQHRAKQDPRSSWVGSPLPPRSLPAMAARGPYIRERPRCTISNPYDSRATGIRDRAGSGSTSTTTSTTTTTTHRTPFPSPQCGWSAEAGINIAAVIANKTSAESVRSSPGVYIKTDGEGGGGRGGGG